MTHEWAHLHTSVLYSLFSPRRPRQPLDAEQMFVSTKFVFGLAWPLLRLVYRKPLVGQFTDYDNNE